MQAMKVVSISSKYVCIDFVKKILINIYGPVQGNGHWRIRYNEGVCQMYGSPDVIAENKIAA